MAGDAEDEDTTPNGDVELTDDEVAAAAAAAQVAVEKQRGKTHDEWAAALLALLALFAVDVDKAAIIAAIDPAADRQTQALAVAEELLHQARLHGHDITWQGIARDAHTAAVLAGAAAAAFIASAGGVPVEPAESDWPDPFDPAPWIAAQHLGLAGDIVDAAARKRAALSPDPDPLDDPVAAALGLTVDDDLEPDDVAALLRAGEGALYYLDVEMSDAYLAGQIAVYAELGVETVWWVTSAADACTICLGLEAQSPYPVGAVPGTPHGNCRCWVTLIVL